MISTQYFDQHGSNKKKQTVLWQNPLDHFQITGSLLLFPTVHAKTELSRCAWLKSKLNNHTNYNTNDKNKCYIKKYCHSIYMFFFSTTADQISLPHSNEITIVSFGPTTTQKRKQMLVPLNTQGLANQANLTKQTCLKSFTTVLKPNYHLYVLLRF